MEDRSEKITGEQERKSDSAEFLKPAEGDSQLIIKLQCGELFEGTTRKLSRTLLILVVRGTKVSLLQLTSIYVV